MPPKHSAPMYRLFRPDVQEPTRAQAEETFPFMNAMPVPCVEPEDVSEVVLFLASDASRYMSLGRGVVADGPKRY